MLVHRNSLQHVSYKDAIIEALNNKTEKVSRRNLYKYLNSQYLGLNRNDLDVVCKQGVNEGWLQHSTFSGRLKRLLYQMIY